MQTELERRFLRTSGAPRILGPSHITWCLVHVIYYRKFKLLALEIGMDDVMECDDSGVSEVSSMGDTWAMQFCSQPRNQYFCEVSDCFMGDEFNLTGLSHLVGRYKEALELILDLEHENPVLLPDIPTINQSGELLYGLIHARYIITRQGLMAMLQKYKNSHFGRCPRVLCDRTGLLPIGRYDIPGYETVRLYCPCCRDIYMPASEQFLGIDGAFFGSSFAGMFLEMMPGIEKRASQLRKQQFQLKLYGFKVSPKSKFGPRMKWLRQTPESEDFPKVEGGGEDPEVLQEV